MPVGDPAVEREARGGDRVLGEPRGAQPRHVGVAPGCSWPADADVGGVQREDLQGRRVVGVPRSAQPLEPGPGAYGQRGAGQRGTPGQGRRGAVLGVRERQVGARLLLRPGVGAALETVEIAVGVSVAARGPPFGRRAAQRAQLHPELLGRHVGGEQRFGVVGQGVQRPAGGVVRLCRSGRRLGGADGHVIHLLAFGCPARRGRRGRSPGVPAGVRSGQGWTLGQNMG